MILMYDQAQLHSPFIHIQLSKTISKCDYLFAGFCYLYDT